MDDARRLLGPGSTWDHDWPWYREEWAPADWSGGVVRLVAGRRWILVVR